MLLGSNIVNLPRYDICTQMCCGGVVSIVGAARTGKTTLSKRILQALSLKTECPQILSPSVDEYTGYGDVFYIRASNTAEDVDLVTDYATSILPLSVLPLPLLLDEAYPSRHQGWVKLARTLKQGAFMLCCTTAFMNLPRVIETHVHTAIVLHGTDVLNYHTDMFKTLFHGNAAPLQDLLNQLSPYDAVVLDIKAFSAGMQYVFYLPAKSIARSTFVENVSYINVPAPRLKHDLPPLRKQVGWGTIILRSLILSGICYTVFKRWLR